MKKIYAIMVLFVAGAVGVILYITDIFWFDLPSLIIVLIMPSLLALGNHSPVEIASYFVNAFSQKRKDVLVLKKGVHFFQSLRRYVYISAVFGAMSGVFSMLTNMGGDIHNVGSGIALTILTLFYAVIYDLLFLSPFEKGMQKRLIEVDTDNN